MSSMTDVLIYVSSVDRYTMNEFNEQLAETTRFNSHPWLVDTKDWSRPNVFCGDVWAFGADYLLPNEVQAVIERIRWKYPQNVVAVVTWVDGHGACETVICRPNYTVGPATWYGDQDVKQVMP